MARRQRASRKNNPALAQKDRGSYFDLDESGRERANLVLAKSFGVEPVDGILSGPHGRSACIWPDFDFNTKGLLRIWFKPWKDKPPNADMMIVIDRYGDLVGGVMTETFRRISKKQSNTSFMFDMCMGSHPIYFDFRRCSICGEPEAPFGELTNWRCNQHKAVAA